MHRFPSASAYQTALQHPEDALVHPDLRGGTVSETLLGAPRAYSGARAAVFPIDLPAGRFALKCFVGNQPEIARRYRALSSFMSGADHESIQTGRWLDEAVRVDGEVVPALLMPWIDGRSLNAFVEQNLGSPETLSRLADRWLEVVQGLASAGMAHADLQHGNVLVSESGGEINLNLIDFDGAFVPALRRHGPLDAGHRHYQHPDRGRGDYNATADRFSAIVIHVALRALERRPDLWDRYDRSENMLFTAADFLEPGGSQLFAELRTIPEIASLSESLRYCCLVRPSDVPSLEEVVTGGFQPGARMLLKNTASSASTRRFRVVLIVSLVAIGMLALALLFTPETALIAASMVTATGVAAALMAFLNSPEERRFRRHREQVRYANATLAGIDSQRAEIREERERYLARREQIAEERLERLRTMAMDRSLRHHFVQEVASEGYASHKVVIRLKRAGVRTASDILDGVLSNVTQVSESNLDSVRRWRADLEDRYAHRLPLELSPAEQRRLERQIQHRLDGFDRDERRLAEREAMQRRVLAELDERRPGAVQDRLANFFRPAGRPER